MWSPWILNHFIQNTFRIACLCLEKMQRSLTKIVQHQRKVNQLPSNAVTSGPAVPSLCPPPLPSRPISGSFAAIIRPPERQPPRRDGAVGGPAPRQPSSASSVTSAHQRRRQQKLGGDALRSPPPPPPPPPPPSESSEPDDPPPPPACSHWPALGGMTLDVYMAE